MANHSSDVSWGLSKQSQVNELSYVFFKHSNQIVVHRSAKGVVFQIGLPLVKVAKDAWPHSVSISPTCFIVHVVKKSIGCQEIGRHMFRAILIKILRSAELLNRLLQTDFDEHCAKREERLIPDNSALCQVLLPSCSG